MLWIYPPCLVVLVSYGKCIAFPEFIYELIPVTLDNVYVLEQFYWVCVDCFTKFPEICYPSFVINNVSCLHIFNPFFYCGGFLECLVFYFLVDFDCMLVFSLEDVTAWGF